ncbi:MAG: hypothetical protein IJ128_03360 [Firmicutes bacterium]|nr:hypothetical protein [Bacillota bacterium]
MPRNNDDREVTFEIVEEIGVISTSGTGWQKELNIVAWNGAQGKYDIREWSPHHDRMSRGITLNEQEMRSIVDLLKRRVRYVPRGRVTISQEPETYMQGSDADMQEPETDMQEATAQETMAREATEQELPMQAEGTASQEVNTFIPRAMEEAPQQAAAF